jgi:signal transduction histidine kinase
LEEKPLYIDDLNEYYKQYTDKSGGRYAKYIFGQALSDSYTVEAIGLALKIGKKQEKFGILTMYRAIKPGEGSGFLTTDAELLEEGAYKMAGLVNALLEHRNDAWQHQDQARHLEVYEAINPVEVKDSFESTTCKQVLKTYRAIEAVFYKADEPDSSTLSHVVGYCRVPNTERLKKLPDAEPDRFVKKAVSNALKAREEDKVAEQRRRLKPAERHNPQAVATEGLVERVCIPLVGAQQFVGMLDIKWKITHRQAGLLDVQHSSINLQHLGTRIGAVYLRHQLAKVNDRNKHAVQAVGAYLFQKAHRLNNAIQDLYSLAQEINDAKTEGDRQASIAELMAKVDEYTDTIKWAMDMGERVQDSSRKKLLVYDLVEESLEVIDRPCDREKKIHLKILDELAVTGSPQLLREIFVNLINNAFDAMEKVKEPSLTIRADHCNEKKDVEIIFEDNGVGMTKAEIKNAENGFVAKGDHTGNGVLISRVMAQVQGGSLSYESEKGVGTKAIVILPAG